MFENNAKGWYGSYSVIGRNLVQRFTLILRKDEILSGNLKKAYYGDYFSTEESKIDEEEENKKKKRIDIFSEEYDKLKEEKVKMKNEEKLAKNANLCTQQKVPEKERYKFHQQHHHETERNLKLNKRKELDNFVSYYPKLDFIKKRTITGPKWQLLKGRNLTNINKKKIKINEKIKEKNAKVNTKENTNANKNKDKNNNFLVNYIFKSIPMNKMTRRGTLPINYDSRIRFDMPFKPKNIIVEEKANNNKNKIKKLDKLENINTSPQNNNQKYLKTYNNNFFINHSQDNESPKKKFNKSLDSKSMLKQSLSTNKKSSFKKLLDKDTFNRTIDFSKILPRNLNVFVQKKVDYNTPSYSNPNYKLTEPRSISMVSYNKNIRDEITPRKFVGIDPQIFRQPNKALDLVNNHKKTSAPNFDIMSGRNQSEGPLPAYMINVWDRRSIETMTDKGLKMNHYSDGEFHNTNYSIFKPKKSFNKMINYTILKNDNEKYDEELKNINEEVFGNKKLKKLIENYSKDNKENNKVNFDVISLKSYKRERKKHKNKIYPLNYQF